MVDLKRSALFARDQPGVSRGPRSAFRPPEEAIQRRVVERRGGTGSSSRFQSPDDARQRPAHRRDAGATNLPGHRRDAGAVNPYWNIRTDGDSPGAYQRTELQTGRIR